MKKGADLSKDGVYRYSLWRQWDEALPKISFIGLNPSTADGTEDDNTIRKCVKFAKTWGYGELVMLNVFAYRDKDPKKMKTVSDPVGPEFLDYFLAYLDASKTIVAAWGRDGLHYNRADEITKIVTNHFPMYCLGTNKDGTPKHPLYLKDTTPLSLYIEQRNPNE